VRGSRRCTVTFAVGLAGCAQGQPPTLRDDAAAQIDAARPVDAQPTPDAPDDEPDAAPIDADPEPDARVDASAPIDAADKPDAAAKVDAAVIDAGGAIDGGVIDGGAIDGGVVTAAIYACNQTTLYKIDPATYATTAVGDFGWPASVGNDAMADIAVAPDGAIIGASSGHLYRCNAQTAICTLLGSLAHALNALSYVPKGAIDPSNEVLVGAAMDGAVYRIDASNGAMTSLGHFSSGHASSGDLAFAGGVLYAAVNPGGTNDSIAKVSMSGGATTVVGTTSLPWVWGLASAGGKLIGFTLGRDIVTIDTATGVATHVGTGPADWYGAAGR